MKENIIENRNYNEDLFDAVSKHNIVEVKHCLENGADPNYNRDIDGEVSDNIDQPTTPLKLLMFRISDCNLNDSDLRQFLEIAKILLLHGADPKPAMEIAEARYGRYNPEHNENYSDEIWHLIANAIEK